MLTTETDVRRWLSTADAAQYLGVAASTLSNDRCSRLLGVPFVKIGRRVLYDRQELDAFLLARMEGGNHHATHEEG